MKNYSKYTYYGRKGHKKKKYKYKNKDYNEYSKKTISNGFIEVKIITLLVIKVILSR